MVNLANNVYVLGQEVNIVLDYVLGYVYKCTGKQKAP
jgi:hypothetical protein